MVKLTMSTNLSPCTSFGYESQSVVISNRMEIFAADSGLQDQIVSPTGFISGLSSSGSVLKDICSLACPSSLPKGSDTYVLTDCQHALTVGRVGKTDWRLVLEHAWF
jgi:hypothetical protein